MDLFSLIEEVPIVRVLALVVWIWWQLALAEEMDWYVYIYISFVFFFVFSILYSFSLPYPLVFDRYINYIHMRLSPPTILLICVQIQTSSHGGGSIMSMYESTATGLGGGGGLEDGGWGDGLAKDLQELVETEGVGMNFEGTNGGEESGLMVRHMCHILCDIFAITHKKTHYGIAYLFFL